MHHDEEASFMSLRAGTNTGVRCFDGIRELVTVCRTQAQHLVTSQRRVSNVKKATTAACSMTARWRMIHQSV